MRSLIERVETVLSGESQSVAADDSGESDAAMGTHPEDGRARDAGIETGTDAPARTLDLPSVETLRERASTTSGESAPGSTEASMPEARVASGGRDRAS